MIKGNLLIVDDEVMLLKMLEFNLGEFADNIFTAENGVLALERLGETEIHCVVCDINMPKMNGVEVIKAIRKKGNEVPFIFYTGHGNQDLMMEAVKYGAFDFLNKPNLDGLEDVISRGLNEGVTRSKNHEIPCDAFISDYQKLLDSIDNDKKKTPEAL